MPNNKVYLRTLETLVEVNEVDGDFIRDLTKSGPLNNLVEYFYFVDNLGDKVDPPTGEVVITMAAGAELYGDLQSGSFSAVNARAASRPKPNGYGKANKVKISITGITGTAVGFKTLITQSVS